MFRRIVRAVRNLFKPAPTPQPPADPSLIKRVALVVGHEQRAQGARAFNGISEYDYWSQVAESVNSQKKNVQVFYRDGTNISGAIDRAADWQPDLIIELHFNAFNKVAHGSEILCTESTPLMQDFLRSWCEYARLRNRGVKPITRGMAGYASVSRMAQRGISGFLFEGFFGDNPNDYRSKKVAADFLVMWIENAK